MRRIAKFAVEQGGLSLLAIILIALASGFLFSERTRSEQESDRLERLATETERRANTLMSLTVSGNLMGAIGLLGITESELKREARGEIPANTPKIVELLESVARSFDAAGVFLVDEKGVAGSAWYASGTPPTGKSLKFRSYYQMAMQGMNNVYAAIGTGNNERILYYAVPIYAEKTNGTDVIGTLVARFEMHQVDNLLKDQADISLLLSPQGLVFASNQGKHGDWIGRSNGKLNPVAVKAVRELKQFGNMFDTMEPLPLPLPVATDKDRVDFDGKPYALAKAKIAWNDPMGDWTLLAAEDLARTMPLRDRARAGAITGVVVLLLGWLLLHLLRSQHARNLAQLELAAHAKRQDANAEYKTRLAAAALRMHGAENQADLVSIFFDETHHMFGALQGALYVVSADAGGTSALQLAGSYACTDDPPATFGFGEGLIGQCAKEKRSQIVTLAPAGFTLIQSGLGRSPPAAVLVAPVLLHESLRGVVEIALLSVPDEAAQTRFDDLLALLAMNIEIISRSAHVKDGAPS